MTTRYRKVNLEVPQEAVETMNSISREDGRSEMAGYIYALADAGWTYTSISGKLGVSRERVRQMVKQIEEDEGHAERYLQKYRHLVPELPKYEAKTKIERVMPLKESETRLIELKPYAERVRANSPRYRAEAEEYTRILAYEHFERGVSVYRLAKILGVTNSALNFRLVRYGYKETNSNSGVYRKINPQNRAV
jgi:hypothetical protein